MHQAPNSNKKLLLRAAERIRASLYRAQIQAAEIQLPDDYYWIECQTICRRLRLARSRGWQSAAAALTEQLGYPLAQWLERLGDVYRQSTAEDPQPVIANLRDILRDLEALSDEFDGVSLDLSESRFSVTTPPIVLEGIALGPFELRLDWNDIGTAHPCKVVALGPNPARSSESTTHPHVVDERLCEGDGKVPLARALREGRLLDFFLIVHRLLCNYNESSAYVRLSEWEGGSCTDCGEVVNPDDERTCAACEDLLCGNCALTCERCDAQSCYECLSRCASCGEGICRGCTNECTACQRTCCESCLSQSDLCPQCKEKAHERSIADSKPAATETTTIAAPAT